MLVTRDTTERPEGIRAGNARLVGTERRRDPPLDPETRRRPRRLRPDGARPESYGDGRAARRIADRLAMERDDVEPAPLNSAQWHEASSAI